MSENIGGGRRLGSPKAKHVRLCAVRSTSTERAATPDNAGRSPIGTPEDRERWRRQADGLVGKPVKVWVGVRLAFGLPERGVVRQYLPDFPGGPTYEVAFSEGDVPFSCLKPEWVFPASESTGSEEAATRQMAYFLFNLGYPYDVQVRDSDGDPVTPPVEVLDLLIEEWRLHEVKPDTDETRDDYRDSFVIELGIDPWDAALRQALEGEDQ